MVDKTIRNIMLENERIEEKVEQNNGIIPLWQVEKQAIKRVLMQLNGNISKSSEILEISRASLYRKIKKYKLE